MFLFEGGLFRFQLVSYNLLSWLALSLFLAQTTVGCFLVYSQYLYLLWLSSVWLELISSYFSELTLPKKWHENSSHSKIEKAAAMRATTETARTQVGLQVVSRHIGSSIQKDEQYPAETPTDKTSRLIVRYSPTFSPFRNATVFPLSSLTKQNSKVTETMVERSKAMQLLTKQSSTIWLLLELYFLAKQLQLTTLQDVEIQAKLLNPRNPNTPKSTTRVIFSTQIATARANVKQQRAAENTLYVFFISINNIITLIQ